MILLFLKSLNSLNIAQWIKIFERENWKIQNFTSVHFLILIPAISQAWGNKSIIAYKYIRVSFSVIRIRKSYDSKRIYCSSGTVLMRQRLVDW